MSYLTPKKTLRLQEKHNKAFIIFPLFGDNFGLYGFGFPIGIRIPSNRIRHTAIYYMLRTTLKQRNVKIFYR
jgi:hypothetical protein